MAFYNNGKVALLDNDMSSVTLKLIFLGTSYTPDLDADVYLSDISDSRADGTTDVTLANVTITAGTTTNPLKFDADDVSVSDITAVTSKFAVYISTGTDTTSALLFYASFTQGTLSPVSGTLGITFNASGLFTLS